MLKKLFLLIISITLLNCAGKNTASTNTENSLKNGPALSVAVVAENNNEAEELLVQHILDHAFKYSNFDFNTYPSCITSFFFVFVLMLL